MQAWGQRGGALYPVRVSRKGASYYAPSLVDGGGWGVDRPGSWIGGGSVTLGLDGQVGREALGAVLNGIRPSDHVKLSLAHDRVKIGGWDLTLGAPKHASVLWALGEASVARTVEGCHDAAVGEAVACLEARGLMVRRRSGGRRIALPAQGMVSGQFPHRLSRSLDPHLHTHVVVANLACGPEGTWSAIDSRAVFEHAWAASRLYRCHLRYLLGTELGCRFTLDHKGAVAMVGVPRSLESTFSSRTAQVKAGLVGWGSASASARRAAAIATRPDKRTDVDLSDLSERWHALAAKAAPRWRPEFALDLGDRGPRPPAPSPLDPGQRRALEVAGGGSGYFRHSDLVAALATLNLQGSPAGAIVHQADSLVDSGLAKRVPAGERVAWWASPQATADARSFLSRIADIRTVAGPHPTSGGTVVAVSPAAAVAGGQSGLVVIKGEDAASQVAAFVGEARAGWAARGMSVVALAQGPAAAAAFEAQSGVVTLSEPAEVRADAVVIWGPLAPRTLAWAARAAERQVIVVEPCGPRAQAIESLLAAARPAVVEIDRGFAPPRSPWARDLVASVHLEPAPQVQFYRTNSDLWRHAALRSFHPDSPSTVLVADARSARWASERIRSSLVDEGLLVDRPGPGGHMFATGELLVVPLGRSRSRRIGAIVSSVAPEGVVVSTVDGRTMELPVHHGRRDWVGGFALTPGQARAARMASQVGVGRLDIPGSGPHRGPSVYMAVADDALSDAARVLTQRPDRRWESGPDHATAEVVGAAAELVGPLGVTQGRTGGSPISDRSLSRRSLAAQVLRSQREAGVEVRVGRRGEHSPIVLGRPKEADGHTLAGRPGDLERHKGVVRARDPPSLGR